MNFLTVLVVIKGVCKDQSGFFLNSYFGYLCTLLLVFVNTAQVFELKDEAVIASSYLFLLDPNDDKLIKIEPVFPLKPKEDFC